MSSKFTWLLISIATLALPVSSSRAADLAEQTRLLREGVQEALANLTEVCAEAWQYDNLRPTVAAGSVAPRHAVQSARSPREATFPC